MFHAVQVVLVTDELLILFLFIGLFLAVIVDFLAVSRLAADFLVTGQVLVRLLQVVLRLRNQVDPLQSAASVVVCGLVKHLARAVGRALLQLVR